MEEIFVVKNRFLKAAETSGIISVGECLNI